MGSESEPVDAVAITPLLYVGDVLSFPHERVQDSLTAAKLIREGKTVLLPYSAAGKHMAYNTLWFLKLPYDQVKEKVERAWSTLAAPVSVPYHA